MNKLRVFLSIILLIFCASNCLSYTFDDEFNGYSLNLHNWNPHFRWGNIIINDELQAYTNNNFIISNGSLTIQARKQNALYNGKLLHYTSGVVTSYEQQIYGKWEVRAKMPSGGMGYWPAIWIVPATQGVYQDIILAEWYGAYPTWMSTSVIKSTTESQYQYIPGNYSNQWHIYSAEWRENFVSIAIDGVEVNRFIGSLQPVPMYLIMNFAISSTPPMGPPDGGTIFPANLIIDYVRISK